jgi:hypothetical protein
MAIFNSYFDITRGYKYWKNPEIFPQLLEVPRSHDSLGISKTYETIHDWDTAPKPWMTWGSTKHITWGKLHGFLPWI